MEMLHPGASSCSPLAPWGLGTSQSVPGCDGGTGAFPPPGPLTHTGGNQLGTQGSICWGGHFRVGVRDPRVLPDLSKTLSEQTLFWRGSSPQPEGWDRTGRGGGHGEPPRAHPLPLPPTTHPGIWGAARRAVQPPLPPNPTREGGERDRGRRAAGSRRHLAAKEGGAPTGGCGDPVP